MASRSTRRKAAARNRNNLATQLQQINVIAQSVKYSKKAEIRQAEIKLIADAKMALWKQEPKRRNSRTGTSIWTMSGGSVSPR